MSARREPLTARTCRAAVADIQVVVGADERAALRPVPLTRADRCHVVNVLRATAVTTSTKASRETTAK
jgi:hypothetical protein